MIIISQYAHGLITIATKNRSVAELSSVIPIEGIEEEVFFFHRIKVLPEHEGTGEGKELMIEVCRIVDELDATIYNGLNPYGKRDMESLKSFFRASGFKDYGDPNENAMIRRAKSFKEPAYFITEKTIQVRKYNPDYGDDRICDCGHPYHRHFDSYDNINPCGCKYCICCTFIQGV